MPSRLTGAFSNPEAKREYVRGLFGTIADRYDLITVLLSFGCDRAWKRRLVREAGVGNRQRVIDLACGTGDLAVESARRGAAVVGLDVTPRMIELARRKPEAAAVRFLVGDMACLPLKDGSADVITTGYGLRNVPDLAQSLSEIHRVLSGGGTLASLDFNRPETGWVRAIFLTYLAGIGSVLGWFLHRDPDTYRYIPQSIRRYPGALGVAALMREAGFADVRTIPVFGGLMTMHIARK
jgi:demethylmenaquinone methyltransferase/2-methoxy-6-polyprenyl-1,4-benzoquinol methylase